MRFFIYSKLHCKNAALRCWLRIADADVCFYTDDSNVSTQAHIVLSKARSIPPSDKTRVTWEECAFLSWGGGGDGRLERSVSSASHQRTVFSRSGFYQRSRPVRWVTSLLSHPVHWNGDGAELSQEWPVFKLTVSFENSQSNLIQWVCDISWLWSQVVVYINRISFAHQGWTCLIKIQSNL